MHVAKMQLAGNGKTTASSFRPSMPLSLWLPGRIAGQASGRLRPQGFTEWYLGDATDKECDDIESRGGTFVYRATAHEMSIAAEMSEALKNERAPPPGDAFGQLGQFRNLWGRVVGQSDPEPPSGPSAATIARMLALATLYPAAAFIVERWLQSFPGIKAALSLLASDDASGLISTDINGRTMVPGPGTWALAQGAGGIGVTGTGRFACITGTSVYFDGSMSGATTTQRAGVTTFTGSSPGGAVCVQNSTLDCYFTLIIGSNLRLFLYEAASGGFHALSSTAAFTPTDIVETDYDGAGGQNVLAAGSVVLSASDPTWAAGFGGMYADQAATQCTLWTVKTDQGGGASTAQMMMAC